MIAAGVQLMVVGMTTVFLFLSALVAMISISAAIFTRFPAAGAGDTSVRSADVSRLIAAAAAYDAAHREEDDDA
jgi:sodium pump decarboxylase gamma subunit